MKPAVILAAALLLVVGVTSSQAAPTSVRVLTVTSRNDATTEKHVDTLQVAATDRVYVTRLEAAVIHPDGSETSVDFAAGYRFGNMTLSKVKP